MSVVKVNAITAAPGRVAEVAALFVGDPSDAPRSDGFEGVDVLAADDGRDVCLVMTRWRDDEAFIAWTRSADFARPHAEHAPAHGDAIRGSEIWSFTVLG